MASDKKFDLDGFSVSDADVCVAAGGFVGDVTGVAYGQVTAYTANGAIDVEDRMAVVSSPISAMTLPTGGAGQELFIYSTSSTVIITPSDLTEGTSITIDAGESVSLISAGGFWFIERTSGVINA